MEDKQYPAANLQHFVKLAREHQNRNAAEGLGMIFDCGATDLSSIYRGLDGVRCTLALCREQAKRAIPAQQPLINAALNKIEAGLRSGIAGSQMGQFTSQWTDDFVGNMAWVVSALEFDGALSPLTSDIDALMNLLRDVDALASDAGIDPRLKVLVMDHTAAIRAAVVAYKTGGITYLERAVEGGVGAFMLHLKLFETAPALKDRFLKSVQVGAGIIRTSAAVVSVLANAEKVKELAGRLIEAGSAAP